MAEQVNLIATGDVLYARAAYTDGDAFVATPIDANYLVKLGQAKYATPAPAPDPAPEPPAPEVKPKRAYRRRDVAAALAEPSVSPLIMSTASIKPEEAPAAAPAPEVSPFITTTASIAPESAEPSKE